MENPVFAARWRIFFFGMAHAIQSGWYEKSDPARSAAHLLLAEDAGAALKMLNAQHR